MLMCRVHSRNMVKVTVNLIKIVANHRKRLELVLKNMDDFKFKKPLKVEIFSGIEYES